MSQRPQHSPYAMNETKVYEFLSNTSHDIIAPRSKYCISRFKHEVKEAEEAEVEAEKGQ